MFIKKLPDEVLFEQRLIMSDSNFEWFFNNVYTVGFASYVPSHRDSVEKAIMYNGNRFGKIMYVDESYFFFALEHHTHLSKEDFKDITKGRWVHKNDCYMGMSK